jgi:hypothetical protein
MPEQKNSVSLPIVGSLPLALQDIGDAISVIGRLLLAGDRLDGQTWGLAIHYLQRATTRVFNASPGRGTAPEGTKVNPGDEDCYSAALPDEPLFVLLARDPSAPDLVMQWAYHRRLDVASGKRPVEDDEKVMRALAIASQMRDWRTQHLGTWKKPDETTPVPTPEKEEETTTSPTT